MRFERRFTKDGQAAYANIEFRHATSEIRNPDGTIVFRAENIEVPAQFSQVATDILAQKYFRKAGVPAALKPVEENAVPSWLWRSEADTKALAKLPEDQRYSGETSAKQVFDRLAGTWTYWGWKGGYFTDESDAKTYFDEMRYMLATQMAASNSPQWFNTGMHWAYGIDGPSQGHFYVDYKSGKLTRSTGAYEHPQPHACFIQSVSDDLVNEGGIMDLWVREARLFKYGSGTGSNFSHLRGEGESLSGGGKSSGQINVRKGDTYFSLAQRHKVPLNALLQANGARPPYALSAGDRLVLPQQAFYKVKPKDTLYSISRKFKTDAASLAELNGIATPYTISVGQMLQTPTSGKPPASSQAGATSAAKANSSQRSKAAKAKKPTRLAAAPRRVGRFRVPVTGPVISEYGPKQGGLHNDGINIAARAGTPIVAAENGVVVYAGNELRGYGNLLLIRHSDGWVTAYAHASKFNVKPGDRVRQGDKVAEVGQTGNVDRPQLHFELRKGTRAVNPKSLI